MTDKEKIKKLKKLADAMYYAAQYLTTDASRLHKAMDEYHKFIIHECKEEPVSDDLEVATNNYVLNVRKGYPRVMDETDRYIYNAFKAGAQWQAEQFEKNRLKHCDSITNEQAELEQGFIDQHLDKYQRMPTFLDAVEYGMRLQKEQMMKESIDGEIQFGTVKVQKEDIKEAVKSLCEGEKVKLIIVKED